MTRLDALFARKPRNILSVYLTAGYPELNSTVPLIQSLAASGKVDMIELGVPFSDPMADGPVIQASSAQALRNGMTLKTLLGQAAEARRLCPELPMVLMGYLNPMIQFGIENLFEACREAGIDAMIIPDLPFHEYMRDFRSLCQSYGIPMIMLITPETSDERIRLIDENCDGFIYMVSAASTTGTRSNFGPEQTDYFKRIDALDLKHPRLIGFGISNPETLADAQTYSSGAIVGSLFIKALATPDPTRTLLTTLGLEE